VQQFACAPQETLYSLAHQAVSDQWEYVELQKPVARLFNQSSEVADWRFITDGPICFAADTFSGPGSGLRLRFTFLPIGAPVSICPSVTPTKKPCAKSKRLRIPIQ
jgi:hypothetical protein